MHACACMGCMHAGLEQSKQLSSTWGLNHTTDLVHVPALLLLAGPTTRLGVCSCQGLLCLPQATWHAVCAVVQLC